MPNVQSTIIAWQYSNYKKRSQSKLEKPCPQYQVVCLPDLLEYETTLTICCSRVKKD